MPKKIALFSSEVGREFTDKNTFSLSKIIAMNLTSSSGFMLVIMLAAIAVGYVREFTIFFFLIHLAVTVKTLFMMLSMDGD